MEQLFFSIIIPTYNRPERLLSCLKSIAQLNYPPDRFEVIVVDDGSEMPIEPVIASFRKQLNLTAIAQQNAGPANARNTGATRARGKFLVFTDDDCMPAPEWLKTLEVRFKAAPN
ncbi:glycosyltransferase family A protein, partial [Chroococcidiopsis sp.]|uniref:glycosyltransferase family A protein n=1 Tax=Chroococcidiopsis sp. TaxID=3088168 RepID=UPI003F3CB980